MANQLTQNPWQLDGSSLNTILVANNIKVKHFEYAGYAAAAVVVLADRFGNIVWRATASADLEEVRSASVGWIDGLQEITHTGGGFILVYFE